jgi:hypothetical protein
MLAQGLQPRGVDQPEFVDQDRVVSSGSDATSFVLPDQEIASMSKPTGKIVLFSGLDHDDSPLPLLRELGACLAERGERVLIVETTQAEIEKIAPTKHTVIPDGVHSGELIEVETQRGLSEYLAEGGRDLRGLLSPSGIRGVDLIYPGNSPFPREAMASASLTKLLRDCRIEYSLILVSAPSTKRSVDLQMLAARADGVVFTVTEKSMKADGADVVDELRELEAPILGFVS